MVECFFSLTLYFKVICMKIPSEHKYFIKPGWIYLPVHPLSILIALIGLYADYTFFIAIDRHSHSASDTLTNFLPYFISVACVYYFFASNMYKIKNAKSWIEKENSERKASHSTQVFF